ncbi:hypothetical protein [Pseudonocardia acidicola]|uniref:Pyrroloquinoline-quinone binding quinoprotein n=1 Tax=Pseudonocardia acidicola TaxID=2724939 RepID=A0ABX1S4Y6_9PSEU|nr:hypothetical protein [Pseudonocardia acidicola]NMH96605.1 hypothetical protein [Pseudonocardia acidicola]
MVAADPATGARRFTVPLPLPDWAYLGTIITRIAGTTDGAGASGGIVVVAAQVMNSDDAMTFGVDLAGHRIAWAVDNFAAETVASGVAVGITHTAPGPVAPVRADVLAVSATDGTTRWRKPGGEGARLAGANLVAVDGSAPDTRRPFFAFLTATDGHQVQALDNNRSPGDTEAGITCHFDQASMTVCDEHTGIRDWAFAIDSTTAASLWKLPDDAKTRVAPKVTAAWHGAVYGYTANGPVVLDGRSGADRNDNPGAAPYLVGPYFGVVGSIDPGNQTPGVYPTSR